MDTQSISVAQVHVHVYNVDLSASEISQSIKVASQAPATCILDRLRAPTLYMYVQSLS